MEEQREKGDFVPIVLHCSQWSHYLPDILAFSVSRLWKVLLIP